MKSQEEIRAEIDRLLDEDRLEEAELLIDQIIPVSREEFRRRLEAAPYDDEPVTPEQQRQMDEVHRRLDKMRISDTDIELRRLLESAENLEDREAVERVLALLHSGH